MLRRVSAKNGAVVASVARPVGVITPASPVGAEEGAHGLGEDAVGVDVASSGQRVAAGLTRRKVAFAFGAAHGVLRTRRAVPGWSSARAAMAFFRAAAFLALAMSGSRLGEELLLLQLDPFPGRVAERRTRSRPSSRCRVVAGPVSAPTVKMLAGTPGASGRTGTRAARRSTTVDDVAGGPVGIVLQAPAGCVGDRGCASRGLGLDEGGAPGVGDPPGPCEPGRMLQGRVALRRACDVGQRAAPAAPSSSSR